MKIHSNYTHGEYKYGAIFNSLDRNQQGCKGLDRKYLGLLDPHHCLCHRRNDRHCLKSEELLYVGPGFECRIPISDHNC